MSAGWKGRPGFTCDAAKQLRAAALAADDAGHALREIAFWKWQQREPVMNEAVLLWMRNAWEDA